MMLAKIFTAYPTATGLAPDIAFVAVRVGWYFLGWNAAIFFLLLSWLLLSASVGAKADQIAAERERFQAEMHRIRDEQGRIYPGRP
jgi:hypothetical protein